MTTGNLASHHYTDSSLINAVTGDVESLHGTGSGSISQDAVWTSGQMSDTAFTKDLGPAGPA
jgi:hypothetical protein